MKSLYKWQKTTLLVIGILTFIAVTVNTFGKEFNFGYFLDLIFGIGLNTLILFVIFEFIDWIYLKTTKKECDKNKIEKLN